MVFRMTRAIAFRLTALVLEGVADERARSIAAVRAKDVPEGVADERARSIAAVRAKDVPETGTASICLGGAFICDCSARMAASRSQPHSDLL
jgi:hypothetical protein